MHKSIFFAAFTSVAVLSGCAGMLAYEKVMPKQIGENTYILQKSDAIEAADWKVELFRQANSNCAAMGKKMKRISDSITKGDTFVFQEFIVELQYECVTK